MNRLVVTTRAVALVAILLVLAVPGQSRNRRGDKLISEGKQFEIKRDFDKALEKYELALAGDPGETAYQLPVSRVRFQAGQLHVNAGLTLRADGKLDEALAEFNKAFTTDPASTVAEQEIRRTLRMIERVKQGKAPGEPVPENERGLTPAQAARKDAEQRSTELVAAPELKPASPAPIDLKIANQPFRTLYESVAKLSGVNVLFDSDMNDPPRNRFSLDLKSATLDEALDDVALLTHTYWKPVNANTIFVTQDTTTKRRDYEDYVTRVFYLTNVTSAQELQEAMTAVRTVTNVRLIFPVTSQNALVVRGTSDQMALAEKIVLDIDKPKSEVLVDMIVMEVNSDYSRTLAAGVSPAGLDQTISFTGGSGTSGTTSTLSALGRMSINDWSTTVPNAAIKAVMSDSKTRVLTSPQLRGIEGQKASLKIGNRYPYATGSLQSAASTGGLPYANTQFSFADLGVNVDLTPRVHGADDVTLQVEFEISNRTGDVDMGGVKQPIIGQRKVNHIIRLREGEAALIGGLMQVTQTSTKTGWPGLASIPLLGRLFSSTTGGTQTEDLLVVLVPHIVRSPDLTTSNLRGVNTGSEQVWKVNYRRAETATKPAAPNTKPAQQSEQPVVPAPVQPEPKTTPAPSSPTAPPTPPPPMALQANPAINPDFPGIGRPSPVAMLGEPVAQLVPSAQMVDRGKQFTVQLNVSNMQDLVAAPMRVKYDAAVLKLVEIKQGAMLGQDGTQVIFSEVRSKRGGESTIQLQRVAGSAGVNGSGTLLTLKFEAAGQGTGAVELIEFSPRDSKLQQIATPAPRINVVVR